MISPFPGSEEVKRFHEKADTDSSSFAKHHTLGPKAHQSAPGNHVHEFLKFFHSLDNTWIDGAIEHSESLTTDNIVIRTPNNAAGPPMVELLYDDVNVPHSIISLLAMVFSFSDYQGGGLEFLNDYLYRLAAPNWINVTGSNGWVNFGGASQILQRFRYPDGDVGIRGIIKNGTATGIMTLPATAGNVKWRPPADTGFEVPISGGGARLLIAAATGFVTIPVTAGSQTFTDINVRFSTIA